MSKRFTKVGSGAVENGGAHCSPCVGELFVAGLDHDCRHDQAAGHGHDQRDAVHGTLADLKTPVRESPPLRRYLPR